MAGTGGKFFPDEAAGAAGPKKERPAFSEESGALGNQAAVRLR